MGSLVDFRAKRTHKELVQHGLAFQESYDHLCDMLARADQPYVAQATQAYISALIRELNAATARTLAPMEHFLSAGDIKNNVPALKNRLERLGDASSLLTHDISIRALMDDIKRDSANHLARLNMYLYQQGAGKLVVSVAQFLNGAAPLPPSPTPANDNNGNVRKALRKKQ